MAALLIPDHYHAEMAILGFDPFQTSSAIFRVIGISKAMRILCMFGIGPFTGTSPYKAIKCDIRFREGKDFLTLFCFVRLNVALNRRTIRLRQ